MKRRTALGAVGVCVGAPAGCARIDALSDGGYAVTDFSVETEKTAPTHEYAITHTRAHDASPDSLARYDDLDPAVAEILRETRETDRGLLRTDELPDGLEGALEAHERFLDADDAPGIDPYDKYKLCRMDPDAPAALELSAKLHDDVVTEDDPAPIEISITNTSGQKRYIVAGPDPPLGLLTAEGPDSDRSFVLWTDYEGIAVTDDGIRHTLPITTTPIAAGKTITDAYELRVGTGDEEPGKGLGPGEYTVSDTLAYRREQGQDCQKEIVEWNVTFTVESR